jgi:hypothetical protein
VLGTRSRHRTFTCSGRRKGVKAGWLESDRRGSPPERGNTPRWALFPFLFPPGGASSQVALAKIGLAHVAVNAEISART